MKATHRITTLAASGLLALLAPATALAHPSVYSTTSRLAKTQEVQTITVDATGGAFNPSAGSTDVDHDASALDVQLALEADTNIGVGNVIVTGADGGPFTVKWVGAKISTNEPLIVPNASLLTGGAGTAIATDVTHGGTNITRVMDPDGSTMPTQEFYVVAEHGYAPLLKETNGSQEGGMLNLKRLPGTYRTAFTAAEWLAYAAAQTNVQVHPVCEGVSALQDPANIVLANESATDPFWDYVPFTKTSAGIADDPADWTDVLQTVLGGSYATTNTVSEFQAACAGLGGVYRPADAAGSTNPIYSGALTDATTPLNADIAAKAATITTLTNEKAALANDKTALATQKTDLQSTIDDLNEQLTNLKNRALTIAPAKKKLSSNDVTLLVTGTAGTKVTIRVSVSSAVAKQRGLRTPVLGTATVTIGSEGAAIAEPMVGTPARRALNNKNTGATITATAGSASATTTATIVG